MHGGAQVGGHPGTLARGRPEGLIPIWMGMVGTWRIRVDRVPLDMRSLTELYDRRASGWDHVLGRLGFGEAYALLMRRLLAAGLLHGLGPGSRILDCGIGSGAFGGALAATVPDLARVDGVDLASAMLATASQRLASLGVRSTLVQADVRALPLGDVTYDAVLTAHVVEHLPDPGRALEEMLRVLRPGGVLVVAFTRDGLLGRLLQWRWRVHCMTETTFRGFLPEGVGEPRFLRGPRRSWFRRMSLVAVVRRPSRQDPR